MSEALVGVIIGGAIASVGPIIQMIYSHSRWKKELKFNYLKERRSELESQHKEFLNQFADSLEKETFSPEISSEIDVAIPEKARALYYDFIEKFDFSEKTKRLLLHNIARELKLSLAEIDTQLNEILR